MEPPPPPDQTSLKADATAYRPWVGLCIWAVMFVGAQLWGGWQRDQQAAELKKYGEERRAEAERHDRKLSEISARMEELGSRRQESDDAPGSLRGRLR